MKLLRRLAMLSCTLTEIALPPSLRVWGDAIRIEVSEIDDDARALRFALGSLFGLAWRGLTFHLLRLSVSVTGCEEFAPGGSSAMNYLDDWQATPRSVGVACAVGATLLGFVFMMMGGAPIGYLGINFGALVIGLLLFANFANTCFLPSRWGGGLIMAAGLALVVTALFGIEVEGIARWIKLGPLSIQPSLVLLPMMIVAFARSGGILATSGIIAAAIALALQPDRAMAAALAAGMIALLVMSQGKTVALAAMASIVGFIVAMVRPDPSPAVPFVDQIIFGSFDIHALAALSVAGGLALLVLPAFAGMRFDNEIRTASLVFGVTWAAVIIAAALGNYPTPVVGYSGGAVLGYVLSLAMLPKTSVSPAPSDPRIEEQSGSDLPANRSFILQPT